MWLNKKGDEEREAGIIEMDGAQEAQILSADDSDCNADEQIFVASLLSFICLRGEPLKDFKWSFLQNEQNTVSLDVRALSDKDDFIGVNNWPHITLHGKKFAGTLDKFPGYIGEGPNFYLSALKLGLAHQGYVARPYKILVSGLDLLVEPSVGEKGDRQTWFFAKVNENLLYVIEVVYEPLPDGTINLDLFVADPVNLKTVPLSSPYY